MFINGKWVDDVDGLMASRFALFADDDGSGGEGGGGQGDDSGDDGGQNGTGNAGAEGEDGGGQKEATSSSVGGLMGDFADGDDDDDGDKASGKTLDFVDDKGNSTALEVPAKFITKDGEINHAAILKAATDSGKSVRQLQNELAEAKKGQPAGNAPEKPEEYLTDDVLKDGMVIRPDGTEKIGDIKSDDPGVKLWAGVAHKWGLSQEQFAGIMGDIMVGTNDFMPEPYDEAAEAEKFGAGAKAVAQTNKAWLGTMLKTGVISEAEYNHGLTMGRDAVGLSLVNKLRLAAGGKNIPVNSDGVAGELPSKEEWYASMPNRHENPDAYAKWQAQGEELFGTDPAGTSENLGGAPSRGGASASTSKPGQNTRTRGTR